MSPERELAAALEYDASVERAQGMAEAYHDKVMESPSTCKHGHGGCAAWEGGPCCDEMLSVAGL